MALSLLDWVAVAIAGRDEPVSRMVRAMIAAEGGSEESTVHGETGKYPARAAALANGATSHALDYDDTHFLHIGHPSVVVISAVLAVAEKVDASGTDFLEAALIGVESACRVGDWLGRSHYQQGFHQTSTAGCFGATVGCARLLGLDADHTRHALGVAATRASGLKSQFGTMGKPYNAGIAASNGVESALLAAAGFVSRQDGLECDQGFGPTHGGENRDLDEVLAGLGSEFVFETVQHKFHACCHGTHAVLEALMEIRQESGLDPDSIEEVVITVHPRWLQVCNILRPATGLEAKFSYRLTAAMILQGCDTASLQTWTDELCSNPELVALRDRVTVETSPDLADTAAIARIRLDSGAELKMFHNLDQAMTPLDREQKVRAKAATLLGHESAERIWQAITALPDTSARQFASVFQ